MGKVAVVPAVQRLVPEMVQTVQKRLEVQVCDARRYATTGARFPADIPQVQFLDSDVVVPVVQRHGNGPDSPKTVWRFRGSSAWTACHARRGDVTSADGVRQCRNCLKGQLCRIPQRFQSFSAVAVFGLVQDVR